ncbi:hypothetical protein NC652_029768 [Populus alba x Populus x berolinensis]|nr:hypothetical protein NC652_029768 [Populus alba x Populus x berolinensis]
MVAMRRKVLVIVTARMCGSYYDTLKDRVDHGSYSRPGSSSSVVAPWKESTGNSAGDASIS